MDVKTNGSICGAPALRGMLAFHSYSSYGAGDSRLFDFGTGVLSCPSNSWNTVYHAINAHFSPDGRLLAFMGICKSTDQWDVFVHEIGSEGEPANISQSLGAETRIQNGIRHSRGSSSNMTSVNWSKRMPTAPVST